MGYDTIPSCICSFSTSLINIAIYIVIYVMQLFLDTYVRNSHERDYIALFIECELIDILSYFIFIEATLFKYFSYIGTTSFIQANINK